MGIQSTRFYFSRLFGRRCSGRDFLAAFDGLQSQVAIAKFLDIFSFSIILVEVA
ncbi:MAG: hypothetical protein H6Q38_1319, partial [Chloroflexi bacterium]|nr:hypothetical protein [Chloroflexota bacterium]